MIAYLRTFDQAEFRISELRALWDKGYLTDVEYAGGFYDALVLIGEWNAITSRALNRLTDNVSELPPKVRENLVSIIYQRTGAGFSPVTGVRIPEEEQREHIPTNEE